MPAGRLLRRRELWVPTLAGWALLALVAGLALAALVGGVYGHLALSAPTGRGLLVVEGWLPAEAVAEAVDLYRRGSYRRLIATGGPMVEGICPACFAGYSDRVAALVRGFGLPEEELAVVPAPASAQERTFRSAVSVRQWVETSGTPVEFLDVYSLGPHARRSRWLYQQAFGDAIAVGVIAAAPRAYDPSAWWQSSDGARDVLSELAAWLWVRTIFDPGEPGSSLEEWGPPRD
jgi:hypothetical protein